MNLYERGVDIEFERNGEIECMMKTQNIIILENVLSEDECNRMINEQINQEGRRNIILEGLSITIMERCKTYIEDEVYERDEDIIDIRDHHDFNQIWRYKEISPYWKLYHKPIGSRISKHYDRMYVEDVDTKSIYSIVIYLNGNNGNIKFGDIEVEPRRGRCVIFNMKESHEGLPNMDFPKYLIRSKIIYRRRKKMERENDRLAMEIYKRALKEEKVDNRKYHELLEESFLLSPLLEKNVLQLC